MGFRKVHCNMWVLRESDTVWALLVYTIYHIRLQEHMQERDCCYISGQAEEISLVHETDVCK